jgi:predicted amidohydrolase YtcJ
LKRENEKKANFFDPFFFCKVNKIGLTSWQALQSATITAAELLKKEKEIGSITKGKFADLIATDFDPITNLTTLEKIGFVMLNGKIIKNDYEKDGENNNNNKKRKIN